MSGDNLLHFIEYELQAIALGFMALVYIYKNLATVLIKNALGTSRVQR